MIMYNSLTYKECIDVLDSTEKLRYNMAAISIAHEFEFLLANSLYGDNDEEFGSFLTEEEKGEIFRDIVETYLNLSDDCSYFMVIKDVVTEWINDAMNIDEDSLFCDFYTAYEEYIKFKKGEE